MQGIKSKISQLFQTIKNHRKKFIAVTVTASVGAYCFKKIYNFIKGLKDSYKAVSKLSEALNSTGDSKINAYKSIVSNFHSSIPQQISYLQKALDQEFHLTILKNKIGDTRFSLHQKFQIFNELKFSILLDLFSMIFIGRMISLTSLVGQIINGEELFDLTQIGTKRDDDNQRTKFKDLLDQSIDHPPTFAKNQKSNQMVDEEKKQIQASIHRQFMNLLFVQFQNFVSMFFEELKASSVVQKLKQIDIKEKFDKGKLSSLLENLKIKAFEVMFKRKKIFLNSNTNDNNGNFSPNSYQSDFELIHQKRKISSENNSQYSEVDMADYCFTGNFHICQLFTKAQVSQLQISQSAKLIIHKIIEQKYNRQSTDRLYLAIKKKIQFLLNLVNDCVGTMYFRALLFDMVELDFNSYMQQLHDQIQRQEKPLQNLIKILPLMNRLRDFLLIPQHAFLSKTKIDQTYWISNSSSSSSSSSTQEEDCNKINDEVDKLDNGYLQSQQKRINLNLVIFIQSFLLQDKQAMKEMNNSLMKKKNMMDMEGQDCSGLLSQLENSMNGGKNCNGQNYLETMLKMMG